MLVVGQSLKRMWDLGRSECQKSLAGRHIVVLWLQCAVVCAVGLRGHVRTGIGQGSIDLEFVDTGKIVHVWCVV